MKWLTWGMGGVAAIAGAVLALIVLGNAEGPRESVTYSLLFMVYAAVRLESNRNRVEQIGAEAANLGRFMELANGMKIPIAEGYRDVHEKKRLEAGVESVRILIEGAGLAIVWLAALITLVRAVL